MPRPRSVRSGLPVVFAAVFLSACGTDAAADAIGVDSGDSTCELSTDRVIAGTHALEVKNSGGQVTEVYVYADANRVVGEIENIKPDKTGKLTVQLDAGNYEVACKPGMTGDGIRSKLLVTGEAAAAPDPLLVASTERYKAYVQNQVDDLMTETQKFVSAVKSGNVEKAKTLYGPSRVPWERIEPIAESFGDIDPKVDGRENDVEPGRQFTGWHRLEKDLWVTGLQPDSASIADQLLGDLRTLEVAVEALTLTPAQMGNGAKELMEEVASGKVTGEEERYSHLDLVDFQANLDGSKEAYEAMRPAVAKRDAALATQLDARFSDVSNALAPYRTGDSFVTYDKLTQAQIRELADKVEALTEPLSKLTATVTA